jgi:hypothetical protein
MVESTMQLPEASLTNICRGAVPERFATALKELLKNIADPNADVTTKRKLSLVFEVRAFPDRSGAEITFTVQSKLASVEALHGNLFLSKGPMGVVKGFTDDPRQTAMFAEEKTDSARQ